MSQLTRGASSKHDNWVLYMLVKKDIHEDQKVYKTKSD